MIFCDSHVHIYDCFDLEYFLDSAWHNFSRQAKLHSRESDFQAVLLLTEAKQDHRFRQLKDSKLPAGGWSFHNTSEPESLLARNANGHEIVIINGRQIVTAENLEVLALATGNELPDGSPARDVVEWAKSNDAIPVIPWGFGKWWGSRGRILTDLLDSYPANELFLGDNSGRPWFLGKPKHFATAGNVHRRILPGTDPLPFPTESWRPGSVGFFIAGTIDRNAPAGYLRGRLKDPHTVIHMYMHCERLVPFIRNQTGMQLRKRTAKK